MYNVGDEVRARVDMVDDQRDHGLGIAHCANRNDKLVVRKVTDFGYHVSHPNVTDSTFTCKENELDPWDGVWDQPLETK